MPGVLLGLDIAEGDIGLDGVAFPFLGDGPAGLHFVHDHLVEMDFGARDDGLETSLDEAVVGVEGVNRFGSVTDDNKYLFHVSPLSR